MATSVIIRINQAEKLVTWTNMVTTASISIEYFPGDIPGKLWHARPALTTTPGTTVNGSPGAPLPDSRFWLFLTANGVSQDCYFWLTPYGTSASWVKFFPEKVTAEKPLKIVVDVIEPNTTPGLANLAAFNGFGWCVRSDI